MKTSKKSIDMSIEKALRGNLGLKPREKFLVVTDKNKMEIGRLFLLQAKKITKSAKLIKIPVTKISGQEPSAKAAIEMKKADVVAIITTKSFTHTLARKKACEKGARVASMPGLNKDIIARTFNVDLAGMFELGKKISNILEKSATVRVTSKKGTDITMSINGRKIYWGDGSLRGKGDFGNLPGSEVCVSPVEGSANGTIVFDASMSSIGKLKNPIKLIVKNGFVVKIEGKEESRRLQNNLKGRGRTAKNIAELGIGTNPWARVTGVVLEDEKVLGTAHIAIGDNFSLGGKVIAGCHLDGVMYRPTLISGKRTIMKHGKLLI